MKDNEIISDEQLNAFLDNQLDDNECAHILETIEYDKSLDERLNELRHIKEMVKLAYHKPPLPRKRHAYAILPKLITLTSMAAAILILITGVITGWIIQPLLIDGTNASFQEVAQFDPARTDANKILLHINTMDPGRVEAALETTEKILSSHEGPQKEIKLEVVANADGLGILREGSPYAKRIQKITSMHRNVSFLACGIARQNAKLKEGVDIKLIPQAKEVPAALDEILKRLKLGWLYIKA